MATFFNQEINIETLNGMGQQSMAGNLEIEFTEIGEDFLIAKMPINSKTVQPMGMLHGGASVVLAETIGSVASNIIVTNQESGKFAVGLAINANHLRPVTSGYVFARCTPLHTGKTTHVWDIKITNEDKKLVCTSRLTMAIVS